MEGNEIADNGSHEVKVYNAVANAPNGVSIAELTVCIHWIEL